MANLTYFKKFETKNEYDTYIGGTPVLPNVSIVANEDVYFKDGEGPEPSHDYSQDYLTFEVISGGTIQTQLDGILLSKDNGENWDTKITGLTSGDKVIAKGDVHSFGENSEASFNFGDTIVNVCGNIMSIYDSQNFRTITTFSYGGNFKLLFTNGTQIISAKNLVLPATTLAQNCYSGMFSRCTSLAQAPELPAMTLAQYCYQSMFAECTSLTTAPELPATTLEGYCYQNMFVGCTGLTTAPELPATTLAKDCYENMFAGCTSLTTAPGLPASTLAEDCYQYMFENCTSLTSAPELPATTLARYCYYGMFGGCSNLNYIKCLATDISAMGCTLGWVRDVASSGTFVKPSTTDWSSKTGTNGIPSNWSVQDA